jgi:hypothetical protein
VYVSGAASVDPIQALDVRSAYVNPYSDQPKSVEEINAWLQGQTLPIQPGIPTILFRDLIYYRLLENGIPVLDTIRFDGQHATVLGLRHGGKHVVVDGTPQIQCLWSNFCSAENPNPIHFWHQSGIYHIGTEFQILNQGKGEFTSMGHRVSQKFKSWRTYGLAGATAISGILLNSEDTKQAEKISRDEYCRWTGVRLA